MSRRLAQGVEILLLLLLLFIRGFKHPQKSTTKETLETPFRSPTRGQSFISHHGLPTLFSSPSLFLHAPLSQVPGPDATTPPVRGTCSSDPGGLEGTNKGPHH